MQRQQQPILSLNSNSLQSIAKFLTAGEKSNLASCGRFYLGNQQTERDWFKSLVQENANDFHPGMLARIRNPLSTAHLSFFQLDMFIKEEHLSFKLRFLLCLYRLKLSLQLRNNEEKKLSMQYLSILAPAQLSLQRIIHLVQAQEEQCYDKVETIFAQCFGENIQNNAFDRIQILSLLNERSLNAVKEVALNIVRINTVYMPYEELLLTLQKLNMALDPVVAGIVSPRKHSFTKYALSYIDTLNCIAKIKQKSETASPANFCRLITRLSPKEFLLELSQTKFTIEGSKYFRTWQSILTSLLKYIQKHHLAHPELIHSVVLWLHSHTPNLCSIKYSEFMHQAIQFTYCLPTHDRALQHLTIFVYPFLTYLNQSFHRDIFIRDFADTLQKLPRYDSEFIRYKNEFLQILNAIDRETTDKKKVCAARILKLSFAKLTDSEKKIFIDYFLQSNQIYLVPSLSTHDKSILDEVLHQRFALDTPEDLQIWHVTLAYFVSLSGYSLDDDNLDKYFRLLLKDTAVHIGVTVDLASVYARANYEIVEKHHRQVLANLSLPITQAKAGVFLISLRLLLPLSLIYSQKFPLCELVPDAINLLLKLLPSQPNYSLRIGDAAAKILFDNFHLLSNEQKNIFVRNLLGEDEPSGNIFSSGVNESFATHLLCQIKDKEICNSHFARIYRAACNHTYTDECLRIVNAWFGSVDNEILMTALHNPQPARASL